MAYKWLESLKRLREDQIARQHAKRLELRFDGFCAHLFALPPARSPFKAPSLAQCRGSSMRNIIPASDWIDYADGREG